MGTEAETLPKHWFGYLTTKNVEQVANHLRGLLTGRTFTFVSVNEFFAWRPDARLHQELVAPANGDAITTHCSAEYAQIVVHDTGCTWTISTSLKDQPTGKDHGDNAYLSFEPGRVTIVHRNQAGHTLYWLICIEQPKEHHDHRHQ